MVVATIEVVVVETVEAVFLTIVELVVSLLILYGDTRMPTVVALMIHQEQSIVKRTTIALDLLTAHAEGG